MNVIGAALFVGLALMILWWARAPILSNLRWWAGICVGAAIVGLSTPLMDRAADRIIIEPKRAELRAKLPPCLNPPGAACAQSIEISGLNFADIFLLSFALAASAGAMIAARIYRA
jgi:hypothetical protein